MFSVQDFFIIVLAVGFLVITACIVFVCFYLVKALKSITQLSDSLEDTTQNFKNKIQLKVLTILPTLVVAMIGRILKRGR